MKLQRGTDADMDRTIAVLDLAVEQLRRAGVPAPRSEAERLWRAISDRLGRVPGDRGREVLRLAFEAATSRRASGAPWQYAAGIAGFRHLDLLCDSRALIPRPETEGLIDLALSAKPAGAALDLGTGSGCLALALASEGSYDRVVAVDRCPQALALARENGARLGISVEWRLGDWTAPVRGELFDVIVSNPPYIAAAELDELEPGVVEWEPPGALDGGPDGLRALERVLRATPAVLGPGGVLFLEIDSRRAAATAALAESLGWLDVRVTQDLFGRDRYLAARRGVA